MSNLFHVPPSYNRDGFLDALKGFAIFTMVIGHATTWLYEPSKLPPPDKSHIWFYVIYSFHMYLLFFVSGFLFHKGDGLKLKDAFVVVRKKMTSLLIPWIAGGLAYYFFRGSDITVLWFLMALFSFSIINVVWELFRPKFKYSFAMDLFYYLWVTFIMMKLLHNPIKELFQLKYGHYLLFSIGIMVKRYSLVKYIENSLVNTITGVVFILVNILNINGYKIPQANIITAITGTILFWNIFRSILTRGHFYEFLKSLGFYSLEIYIMHGLFIIKIFAIGTFITTLTGFKDDMMTRSTVELLMTTTISVIVITLCLIFIKATKNNIIINFLFGKIRL